MPRVNKLYIITLQWQTIFAQVMKIFRLKKKYGYLNAGLKISMSKEIIDGNILIFHVFHAKKE